MDSVSPVSVPPAPITPAPDSRPSSRSRKLLRPLGFCLLALAVLYLAAALMIDHLGQVDGARPADVIIVLGGVVTKRHQPGDSLRERTLHAAGLYRRGLAPYVMFTGGQGEFSPPEAVAAARLALREGVPSHAMALETRSRNTRENARFAAELCRQRGWQRVVCVSDPYHMARVRFLFEREGLTVHTSPARQLGLNGVPELRITRALGEVLNLLRDAVQPR